MFLSWLFVFLKTDSYGALWLLRAAASKCKKTTRPFVRLLSFRITSISCAECGIVFQNTGCDGSSRRKHNQWNNNRAEKMKNRSCSDITDCTIVRQEVFKVYLERREAPDHWLPPAWKLVPLPGRTEESLVHLLRARQALLDRSFSFFSIGFGVRVKQALLQPVTVTFGQFLARSCWSDKVNSLVLNMYHS